MAADGHRHAVVVRWLLGNAFHARDGRPPVWWQRAASRYPRLHLSTATY